MTQDFKRRALIVAGHGSAKNPNTRKPICACVQAIKATGMYEVVRCGLWKEDPHVSVILEEVLATGVEDVTVVPFFISDGYYVQEVIPREMKLTGRLTRRLHEGRKVPVRYTVPVGTAAGMAELVVRRAREAGARGDEALAVLGHGTPRNPNSEKNVYAQAERVAALGAFPEVVTCFLDQEPSMMDVWARTERDVVMVPLFIADGWHVAETIPEELAEGEGLRVDEDGTLWKGGRSMRYAKAVGTDPGFVDVVLRLCAEAAEWED